MPDDAMPMPSPGDDEWPAIDGQKMTGDEFEEAIVQLYERGLLDITVDEDGRMWLSATEDGIAAFMIETAMGHLNEEADLIMDDPDGSP
jgi:ligand-binding sensor domain-containing protein